MNTKIKVDAVKTLEDVAAQAKEAVEEIVKASQEQVTRQFEQTMTLTKDQVEKASQQMLKSYDEMTAFNKQNVDAVIQSGTIVAKGVETLGKAVASFTQTSIEQSVATGKALLTVKSMRDLVDLQSAFAKSAFDAFMAESTRMSEMSVKVANEALAPINARVNATVEKFARPIAA